jgi:hypothetical protein
MEGHAIRSILIKKKFFDENQKRDLQYINRLKSVAPILKKGRVVVGDHVGGLVYGIGADVEDINHLGLRVEIVGKYCNSSCTLFLGAKKVCVSPETLFGFHKPRKSNGSTLNRKKLSLVNSYFGKHYKKTIRDWWEKNGSRSTEFVYLKGDELIKHGYQSCLRDGT